jgi:predicted DNA-binding protein (MmcQ/YjbR family)
MNIEDIRQICLALPHATEIVQWGSDLVFKVAGKMFAVMPTEVAPVQLSFKCTPENFVELCERPGVIPAPYMARAQWVALEQLAAIPDGELGELLAESHRLVWEKLPKKTREQLASAPADKLERTPKKARRKSASGSKRGKKSKRSGR